VGNFDTSGVVGFRVQPFYLNSYTTGLASGGPPPFGNGIGAGWAGVLIDTASVKTNISIEENYVHDGFCGDGIDLRSVGTGNATAQVNRNFVTGLKQCSGTGVGTIEGIGTQVTGTGVLYATLDGNTEARTGSPGANMDSLFVNPAESGTLIESIKHNLYTTGIGGASTNGMEFIISNGKPYAELTISDSAFYNNPGDMLELFNRGELGSTGILILDHVLVDGTTISRGLPTYAVPTGGANGVPLASTGDNTGECLGIASVGAGDVTMLLMSDSEFVGCGNNGIEITDNHCMDPPSRGPGCGTGDPHLVSIDIERSRISGSRFYNLWMNDVTALTELQVRVQDTDLSTSQNGVAVAFDQQPTGSRGSYVIDLGGGMLDSKGRNCIFGGAIYDLEAKAYNVSTENNWWGTPSGPISGKVVATNGGIVDDAELAYASAGGLRVQRDLNSAKGSPPRQRSRRRSRSAKVSVRQLMEAQHAFRSLRADWSGDDRLNRTNSKRCQHRPRYQHHLPLLLSPPHRLPRLPPSPPTRWRDWPPSIPTN
jgi:hypothetical protein